MIILSYIPTKNPKEAKHSAILIFYSIESAKRIGMKAYKGVIKVDEASLYSKLYESIDEAGSYCGSYNPCNIILIIS